MIFNHIMWVQGWMTMACHIYDPVCCKVMTIAIYDMQSKDIEVQWMLWRQLNIVVEKKKMGTLMFKGFMVDGAQANWNDVRIIYGTQYSTNKTVDKKRMCLFH